MRVVTRVSVVAALLTSAFVGVQPAQAKPGDPAYPTQAQIDRSHREVRTRAERVAEASAALAATSARVASAHETATEAAEAYEAASFDLFQARREARRTAKAAVRARAQVEEQRRGIGQLVAQSYQMGGALDDITTFMTGGDPAELMDRSAALESGSLSMKLRLDEFHALSRKAVAAEAKARTARQEAIRLEKEAHVAGEMAALTARAADNASARLHALTGRLSGDLSEAKAITARLEKQRRDALEALGDDDPTTTVAHLPHLLLPWDKKDKDEKKLEVPRTYPGPVENPPAPDEEAAARAIAFAKDQLGDMYLWAATGPDRWDCSGLTMGAWAAGGKQLVHYSEAQYLMSIPIKATDLAPGDLVFWQGAQVRIHHVALYIGDGKILHAPRSGQPVQIVDMGDFSPPDFFARPR